jgi:hypothetical protein
MARRESVAPLKLAFFVEGDMDKAFIEALVPRIIGQDAVVRVVRIGGKAAFSSTFYEAAQFVEAGYASVFLIVDADTALTSEIENQRQRLAEVFRRYGLEDRVQICMAVPMLESWLLTAYQEDPERSTQPNRDLARFAGASDIRTLATELSIDEARRRSRSFDAFVAALEAFAPKARRTRSAARARRARSSAQVRRAS